MNNRLRISALVACALIAAAQPSLAGIIPVHEDFGSAFWTSACSGITCAQKSEFNSPESGHESVELDDARASVRWESMATTTSSRIEIRGKASIDELAIGSLKDSAYGEVQLYYYLQFTVPTAQVWRVHDYYFSSGEWPAVAYLEMYEIANSENMPLQNIDQFSLTTLTPGEYQLNAWAWPACALPFDGTIPCYLGGEFRLVMSLVPEPGSFALLVSGLTATGLVVRRRNRSSARPRSD